jgi:hypothetical protein
MTISSSCMRVCTACANLYAYTINHIWEVNCDTSSESWSSLVLPNGALRLPTFSHFLIVSKTSLSHSISLLLPTPSTRSPSRPLARAWLIVLKHHHREANSIADNKIPKESTLSAGPMSLMSFICTKPYTQNPECGVRSNYWTMSQKINIEMNLKKRAEWRPWTCSAEWRCLPQITASISLCPDMGYLMSNTKPQGIPSWPWWLLVCKKGILLRLFPP